MFLKAMADNKHYNILIIINIIFIDKKNSCDILFRNLVHYIEPKPESGLK